MAVAHKNLKALPEAVLQWYEAHAREMPWRVGPKARAQGTRPNPYHIWLCEIMMQQTTIPHGTPYFHKFVTRWPSVEALAAAKDEAVMAAWAGLGYYARARNLLKCAREVTALGAFPETAAELQKLPGIGPYTAGAIAAIAFDAKAAAVDGNVERVFSRVLALKGEWKVEKKHIADIVRDLVPADRPGEFAEALMDLGATICSPKAPNCLICPISGFCKARAEGTPDRYPIKPAKKAVPVRRGIAYALFDEGDVWLMRRPDSGLLGGMLALPTTEWKEVKAATDLPPCAAAWTDVGEIRHVFTHFALYLRVQAATLEGPRPDGAWEVAENVDGLPTVFAKALKLANSAR